jgi:CheY-like chemotaxis protein
MQKLVLIVEKNKGSSYMLQTLLGKWGYSTFVVDSYLKAIEYAKNDQMDIGACIVDSAEINAILYEFPRKFLERTGKSVHMIIHTVVSEKSAIAKAIESGYKDYLVRPIDPESLKNKLESIFNEGFNFKREYFQCNLYMPATLITQTNITTVNEQGIEAILNWPIPLHTTLNLSSSLFQEYGLVTIPVFLVEIRKISATEYHAKFAYSGVTEDQMKNIRRMVIHDCQSPNKAA